MYSNFDHKMMRRALILALRGRGAVSPNPRVGAVVVGVDGRILAEGWHRQYGGAHAEVDALRRVKPGAAAGGTLYVNLEPCCHYHKTPPCTDAIISSGVTRVVAAITDPYLQVNGAGFKRLQSAGIAVSVGLMAGKAAYLNRGFLSTINQGRAWCAAKTALSLDGKMAAPDGQSKWISGVEARTLAHRLRADHDAVLVGGGTVAADDPELTVRLIRGVNPVRIILSPHAGLPAEGRIASSASQIRTILVVGECWKGSVPPSIEVLRMPEHQSVIDPVELLTRLPSFGVTSVLVEGGAGVLSSFLQAGVLDEISIAYAPSVIGKGLAPFDRFIPESWEDRPRFSVSAVKRYGEEVVVTYHPARRASLPV